MRDLYKMVHLVSTQVKYLTFVDKSVFFYSEVNLSVFVTTDSLKSHRYSKKRHLVSYPQWKVPELAVKSINLPQFYSSACKKATSTGFKTI